VCIIDRDESIKAVHVPVTPTSNAFDLIAIDILNLEARVRIVTVYRPPATETDQFSRRWKGGYREAYSQEAELTWIRST